MERENAPPRSPVRLGRVRGSATSTVLFCLPELMVSFLVSVLYTVLNSLLVPVYDGTTDDIKFTLANYTRKLPTYSGEIPANSTVLIVFTTGPYDIPNHRIPDGAPKDLAKSTSLNIKSVVVLYEAITAYSRTDLPEESSWGVIPAPVHSEGSGDGAKEDSGDEGAF